MHANKLNQKLVTQAGKGQNVYSLLFGLAVPPLDTAEAFAGVANDSALFIPVLSQNSI